VVAYFLRRPNSRACKVCRGPLSSYSCVFFTLKDFLPDPRIVHNYHVSAVHERFPLCGVTLGSLVETDCIILFILLFRYAEARQALTPFFVFPSFQPRSFILSFVYSSFFCLS